MATEEKVRPEFLEERMLSFLDALSESGATNMFGATPYVQQMFPELSKNEARKVLTYWMETFSDRHPR